METETWSPHLPGHHHMQRTGWLLWSHRTQYADPCWSLFKWKVAPPLGKKVACAIPPRHPSKNLFWEQLKYETDIRVSTKPSKKPDRLKKTQHHWLSCPSFKTPTTTPAGCHWSITQNNWPLTKKICQLPSSQGQQRVLSHVTVTKTQVWIGNWIYWPLTGHNYK
jgi:hypothetical protein